jgi:hypothetical protein
VVAPSCAPPRNSDSLPIAVAVSLGIPLVRYRSQRSKLLDRRAQAEDERFARQTPCAPFLDPTLAEAESLTKCDPIWKVTFQLVDGLPMTRPEADWYIGGRINASISEDPPGSWQIVCMLIDAARAPAAAIIESTRDRISVLIEAIRFRSGLPNVVRDVVAVQLTALGEAGQLHRAVPLEARTAVALPFSLPPEARLLARDRLHVWLRLINDARASLSDVESIRNCFMICEDIQSEDSQFDDAAQDFIALKATRDFVSHGRLLGSVALLQLLERHLGTGTRRFNPTDDSHVAFVRSQRPEAERFVTGLIEQRL